MNNFFEKVTLKPEMRPHAVYFKQNIKTEMFSFRERNLGKVNWMRNLYFTIYENYFEKKEVNCALNIYNTENDLL